MDKCFVRDINCYISIVYNKLDEKLSCLIAIIYEFGTKGQNNQEVDRSTV